MPLATELARLLRTDPIATSQIKEHIPPGELRELLDLPPTPLDHESVKELLDASEFTDEEVLAYLLDKFSTAEILRGVADKQ